MTWDEATVEAIGSIYDSVDAEHGWEPALTILSNACGSAGGHLFLHHIPTGEFLEDCMVNADESSKALYQQLAHTDPSWPIGLANPGVMINDVDHFSDRFFESTPIYNEVMKWQGARYRVTNNLPLSDELIAGFAIIRAKSAGPFEKTHVERLDFFLSHLVRALRLQRRLRKLEGEAGNISAALDHLPTAVLIVSESLEIVCVNRQADALLGRCKTLRVRHGNLVPEGCDEASALRQAVGDAIALADSRFDGLISPPQVVTVRRPDKLPLDILAVPLRPRYRLRENIGQNARVLLMIYDPEARPKIDPRLLERLFNLTSTEAVIAARLAEGMSVAEIARARRCSTSTVRTHVKHIFQKTHINRQGELVQLLLTSPAISFAGA